MRLTCCDRKGIAHASFGYERGVERNRPSKRSAHRHVGPDVVSPQQTSQRPRDLLRVVLALDQRPLECDALLLDAHVLAHRRHELVEPAVPAIGGQQRRPLLVRGAVQRQRQSDLQILVHELFDVGHDADGGNGDLPRPDPELGVHASNRGQDVAVVGQRFPHAHHDYIG